MTDFTPKKRNFSIAKIIILLLAVFVGLRLIYWHLFLPMNVRASDLTLENILNAINKERSLRNLVLLNTDSRLSLAAQGKATDMQARHYFSHTDPEGNYIWPKIVAAGYTPYLQLGENLAIEFYNTDSLVNAWMNSPTHRANVLN
ncbi:MAG: CAP domain-containing protein, partial [Patescibacteria group bacterium]|nr:CAP domain-containing protein [Patescibacteria group bacterium]